MKKWYKDILATVIFLGVIGIMVGLPLLLVYGPTELVYDILKGLLVLLTLFFLFAVWKLIRMLID